MGNKYKRFLILLATLVMLLSALAPAAFAEETEEPVCYNHGDVNGDGVVDSNDAIYTLYSSLFGSGRYPVSQDCDFNGDSSVDSEDAIYILYASIDVTAGDYPLKGVIHSYYDPTWQWDEATMVAAVTFKCGCGDEHTFSSDDDDAIEITTTETKATCIAAGSVECVAKITFDGVEYSSTKKLTVPAGNGHQMVGTQDCENGSACELCDYELPALGHNWVLNAEKSTAATCQAQATRFYECACGETKTVTLEGTAAHAYAYMVGEDLDKGDCKFVKQYKCSACGAVIEGTAQSDTYYKHTYTATLTKEATCSEAGEKTYTCGVCNDSYTETVAKNDSHKWIEGDTVENVTAYTCEYCDATKTSVSVSNNQAVDKSVLESAKELQLDNDAAISLDEKTLEALDSEKQIQISVAPADLDATGLTEEEKSQVGDNTVYDFNMAYSDGTPVTEFAGEVTISLPYTLAPGEDIDSIDVWYIDDEGKLTQVFGTYSNGCVTFTTTHFSYYTVTRLTPVQRCERYGHIQVDSQKQATCTEDGYNMSVCQRCGVELAKEVLPMSGHSYQDTENTKAPTCTEDGYSEQKCENCGDIQKGTVPALGHELTLDAEQSVTASCATPGKDVYVCGRECGHTYVDEKPQLEHIYMESESKDPDCTNKGYKKNKCSLCGVEEIASESAPTGHNYLAENAVWEWASDDSSATVTLFCSHNDQHTKTLNAVVTEKTVSASCTSGGSVVYTATASFNNVTYTDSRTVTTAALGHKPGTEWKTSATQHYHECSICGGKADAVAHTWGDVVVTKEATCNASGTATVACTVCGYETQETLPATGKHNYVNDVCADCGYDVNECDHLRMYSVPVELGDHDVCGEFEIWYQSCSCGERRWLEFMALECTWGEATEKELTTEDGQQHILYSRTCTVCGLTMENANYSKVDEEACTMDYYEYYHFSQNGATILEDTVKSMIGWGHPESVLVDEVDLSDYGLCGGVLEIRACPCGDNLYVYHIESEACEWVVDDANMTEDTDVYSCAVCGAQKTCVYTSVRDEENPCHASNSWKYTYSKNGEQLYTYTEYYSDEWHNFEITGYEMDGTSCEDGVMIMQTCTECGEESKYYTTWHDPVVDKTIDVSVSGMCCDRIIQWTCACDAEYGDYYYDSEVDGSYCSWTQIGYNEATETSIYQCTVCGTTRTETITYGEKGQNCSALCTETTVFANQNGETIATVFERWDSTNHDMQQSAVLKGDSCEDGVTIINSCADCDYQWTSDYSYHVGIKQATYDMSELDICGELLIEIYSCPCGRDTWMNWQSNDCVFNWIDGDSDYDVYECANCGTVQTVEYEDGEKIDDCHIMRHTIVTFTDKNQKSVSFAFDRLYETHREIYHMTLAEGATDCTGGVTIVRECLDCGEKTDWGTTNEHGAWVVAREIIAEGKLCGTLELMTVQCACGQESWNHTEWTGDDSCSFQWSEWSEEYDADVYTCSKCGVYYVRTYENVPVEGTTCEYDYITTLTYFDKNGVELDSVSYSRMEYNHRMVATFQLQGETCDDGYTVTETCVDCGTSYDHDQVYTGCSNWIVAREIIAEGKLCGTLEQLTYQCACGQQTWQETNWPDDEHCEFQWDDWSDEYDSHVYVCTKCGAFYTENYEETLVEGTTCEYLNTTTTTYYDKAGVELDTATYSRTEYDHRTVSTFQMLGESCEDGYYRTVKCMDCDYSYADEELRTDHNYWTTENYRLEDYGMCGGELWKNGCACGQHSEWSWSINCNYSYTNQYDSETGFEERYCAACKTSFYMDHSGEENRENCRYEGDFYFKAVRDDETLLTVEGQYGYVSHTYMAANFTLNDPNGDCENGYTVELTCAFCDESITESSYWHNTYVTEMLDLSEYNTCGGYVYAYRCACGYDGHINTDYDCDMNHAKSWNEKGLNGEEHHFEKYICKDCGLIRIHEYYEVDFEDSCEGMHYYNETLQLGDTLDETLSSGYRYENHDYVYSYTLAEGAVTCEDGITVHGVCKDCGEVSEYTSDYHGMNLTESIDLTAYGSICGGNLDLYQCPCGEKKTYQFNDELLCDLDERHVEDWIEGSIYDSQPTTEWWQDTYSESYTFTCAVTDPEACSLKIRMSEYWLKEGCEAVEYQTWQLGYDAATGTCQQEVTIATGERHAYHGYTVSSISETQDDGTQIYGTDYTCPDCGSYFVDKNYYVNGEQTKYTVDAVNTLGNDELQKMSEIVEYGYEYGDYRYRTYERDEYTYSDGEVYWSENTWTYDFSKGCYAYRTHTDVYGNSDVYYEEAHLGAWNYEVVKQSTCSQFGEEIGRETCQVCNEVYYEYTYDIEPNRHYWNWDDSLQLYVCSTCGLENVNGASGAITMEDMTETYGNGTQYVIGYWNSDAIRFNPYVSVILDDVDDENNELVLTGITFTYWTVKDNGVTALVFDQAAAQTAADAAVADAGYTGSYAIRISFVPVNSDDTLDYAITFDSQSAA